MKADGYSEPSETDLLASLLTIRALRDKLLKDEMRLIGACRRKRVNWSRIAAALEVGSRQSAERRYWQLRTDFDERHGSPLTQHERVSYARDQRERRAERVWAAAHALQIHHLAERLIQLEDLQERANRAASTLEAHRAAVREAQLTGDPAPASPVSSWPERLRSAINTFVQSRVAAPVQSASDIDDSRARADQTTDASHRLYGLVVHATDPGNVDLSDQQELTDTISTDTISAMSKPTERAKPPQTASNAT